MRSIFVSVVALLLNSTGSSAESQNEVRSTWGTTNVQSTDWNAYHCNGETTILQCTLNGSGAEGRGTEGPGVGAGDGVGGDDGGKH